MNLSVLSKMSLRPSSWLPVLSATVILWGAPLLVQAASPADTRLAEAAMARDMTTVQALLREKGADVNALGPYKTPALQWVVRIEDTNTAKRLLDAGADPNIVNGYGITALHLAIENQDEAMVKLLLAAGANPLIADRTGETAIFMGARSGSVPIVKLLLEHGASLDEQEPAYQQTPLMMAIRSNATDLVRFMLQRGVKINVQSDAGKVPGFRLPSQNAGSKGVGIVRGGWPEQGERAPVGGAKSPLLYATREGNLAITKMLVEAGAELEIADANGLTPLINSIINAGVTNHSSKQYFEVAQYLIEHGANVNASDWYGETPLWAAVVVRNQDVSTATRDNGIDRDAAFTLIQQLLDKGANPNARTQEQPPERRFITRLGDLSWVDFTGQTAFLRAALSGDVKVMKLLVAHDADPNITTLGGTTPLMAAAGMNWTVSQTWDEGPEALLEAVKLAHSLGNDINAVNSMGLNAVHAAANRGSDDIIRYLAANGAALNVADKQGRTPMTWAEGVFLATHPPVRRPETMALLQQLSISKSKTNEH